MGKGDKKSRRGKIANRSYGVRRPKKQKKATILSTTKTKPKTTEKAKPKAKAKAKK